MEASTLTKKMTNNLVALKDLIGKERVQIDSGILLTPVVMSTQVGDNHEINDSDDVPSDFASGSDCGSDKYYDSDSDDSESEFEMEDLNDLVEDGERIAEELDRIVEELTDKNQLTSEEDDCCVKNLSIQEAKYIEKVEEFNSSPMPPKYNHKTGK